MLKIIKNTLISLSILALAFGICLFIQNVFLTETLIPAVFVLAVFLIAFFTEGYIYGIISALFSVLIFNFAFSLPFFKFDFTIPENIISAVIMIIVTIITGALTTQIKRQEAIKAESEKERMRANLLRAVSHDLRTPLTTIYGASSTILDNFDIFSNEQKITLLKGIREDSQWLTRMVENLLSVTKLDGGKVKLLMNSVPLEELIDSVLRKFRKRYPEQEVIIDIPDEFISIPMDALLIEQVLVNILDNAVEHAEGMTELRLKVKVDEKRTTFEISDNGCGIDAERLKTIFTGCGGGTAPTDTKINSGIGLSVCATIIKAHGGEIFAESPKNGGAVFSFCLNNEENCDE
ncbi:MAG: PAS domain-containing sensor histidine kinase [Ruminococcus sp.]|nr:PAS domain-containing sensor histidine kinase [Ruminococcus sp.]